MEFQAWNVLLVVLLAFSISAGCSDSKSATDQNQKGDTVGQVDSGADLKLAEDLNPTPDTVAAPDTTDGTSGTEDQPAPDESTPDQDQPDSTPDSADTSSEKPKVVTFIATGDTGTGSKKQYDVANAIKQKCDADGCDFMVILGDMIYDDGPSKSDDKLFTEYMIDPYKPLEFPIYLTMGNHDYGQYIPKPQQLGYYVDFASANPKFKFPDPGYYDVVLEHSHFLMLDTQRLFLRELTKYLIPLGIDLLKDEQDSYFSGVIQNSTSTWRVVTGHHPYFSNGAHGNAGNYESVLGEDAKISLPLVDAVYGIEVKKFYDNYICGKVDFIISGHDHNMQHISDTCKGTVQIVSGAGAKIKDFKNTTRNQTYWQDDQQVGFTWIKFEGKTATVEFRNCQNKLLHYCTYHKDSMPTPVKCENFPSTPEEIQKCH